MRNKSRKYGKMMRKKYFTKQELLILKKYPRLIYYGIPYNVINRAYCRYLRNLNSYLMDYNYPEHWFSKDRMMFCIAIKTYIESKKENHIYNLCTRGWTAVEITKLSGLDKYLDDYIIESDEEIS